VNPALAAWAWGIAALVFAGFELAVPGVFLIWLGGAAAITAVIAALFAPEWQWQVVHFVLLAVIFVLLARQLLGARAAALPAPRLNRRAEAMIGTRVTVVEAIADGTGRVQVGDSPWPAAGPDMAAGTVARIVRVEGTTLVVDQA